MTFASVLSLSHAPSANTDAVQIAKQTSREYNLFLFMGISPNFMIALKVQTRVRRVAGGELPMGLYIAVHDRGNFTARNPYHAMYVLSKKCARLSGTPKKTHRSVYSPLPERKRRFRRVGDRTFTVMAVATDLHRTSPTFCPQTRTTRIERMKL